MVVCSRYSAVGMMDCHSEGRDFEPVSGILAFEDKKMSNPYHAACCSGALLATLSRFMFLYVMKNASPKEAR